MNILLVNSSDQGGGAEVIVQHLLKQYLYSGHNTWLVVGHKKSENNRVLQLANTKYSKVFNSSLPSYLHPIDLIGKRLPGANWIGRQIDKSVSQSFKSIRRWLGREEFDYPGTQHLLDLTSEQANLVHAHNLHGDYFDLRYLIELSKYLPVVLTLHDAWLLSGHCTHSFSCERWTIGCGHCPDLTIYPAIRRDGSAYNWNRKRAIFSSSRLYIATPSNWLMEKVERSILKPAIVSSRVIPNGVDLNIFTPSNKASARIATNLPLDASVILFVANGMRKNPFKDYETLRIALEMVGSSFASGKLILIALGEASHYERLGNVDVRFVPFHADQKYIADYYKAADLYVHAAKIETFPTTILEALACGTPVIASAVGGINEQVEHGETGFLIPKGDSVAMSYRIKQLLKDTPLRRKMGKRAVEVTRNRFSSERMSRDYLKWFEEIINLDRNNPGNSWQV